MADDLRIDGAASRRLAPLIEQGRERFAGILGRMVGPDGASLDQYARYLTMQFHLTRDVQTYFITAAGHRDLARRRKLRKFLVEFANEEELHYLVAARDLAELGLKPGDVPIDVTLWHAYFRSIVGERPFVRLGAACVLESISGGVAREGTKRALSSPFLNQKNTKFLVLHQHETLPHGDQLLSAFNDAALEPRHLSDLAFGASVGLVLYMRMAEWALDPGSLAAIADAAVEISEDEAARIANVRVGAGYDVTIG